MLLQLLLALLAVTSATRPIIENALLPKIEPVNFLNRLGDFSLGEVIEVNISQETSQLGEVLILERKLPIDGNLSGDYHSNPALYTVYFLSNSDVPVLRGG